MNTDETPLQQTGNFNLPSFHFIPFEALNRCARHLLTAVKYSAGQNKRGQRFA